MECQTVYVAFLHRQDIWEHISTTEQKGMSAAGDGDSAPASPANASRKTQLTVYNKAGDLVAAGVTADSFMDFKRKWGTNTAVVVELECGEEIFVSTCKLFKRLPRGATYQARLLRRTSAIPDELAREATGCHVWKEV